MHTLNDPLRWCSCAISAVADSVTGYLHTLAQYGKRPTPEETERRCEIEDAAARLRQLSADALSQDGISYLEFEDHLVHLRTSLRVYPRGVSNVARAFHAAGR
jgi:hypothetical protein